MYTLRTYIHNISPCTTQITLSRVGGIGLELLEMQVSDDNRAGLVMIGGCSPESNAEKCGLFLPGDVLMGISSVDGKLASDCMYIVCILCMCGIESFYYCYFVAQK